MVARCVGAVLGAFVKKDGTGSMEGSAVGTAVGKLDGILDG